jgi:hypothetical protein
MTYATDDCSGFDGGACSPRGGREGFAGRGWLRGGGGCKEVVLGVVGGREVADILGVVLGAGPFALVSGAAGGAPLDLLRAD